jgi:hypothetical protein
MTDVNRRVVEKIMLLTFSNSPYTTTGSADGASASTEEEGTALQRSGNPPTLRRLLLARCIVISIWWCVYLVYVHIYKLEL